MFYIVSTIGLVIALLVSLWLTLRTNKKLNE